MIQATLIHFYCRKFVKIKRAGFFIESINTCQLSYLFIHTQDCIYRFIECLVLNNLYLTNIKDIHDLLDIKEENHQIVIDFLACNVYCLSGGNKID